MDEKQTIYVDEIVKPDNPDYKLSFPLGHPVQLGSKAYFIPASAGYGMLKGLAEKLDSIANLTRPKDGEEIPITTTGFCAAIEDLTVTALRIMYKDETIESIKEEYGIHTGNYEEILSVLRGFTTSYVLKKK